MRVIKTILFLAFLLLVVLFTYYNPQEVELRFLNYSLKTYLFLSLILSFIGGFLLAYLYSELKHLRACRQSKRFKDALIELWTGRYAEAEAELSKVLEEEVVPLYLQALERLGKEPSLYLQKYNLGIAETALARRLFKEDRNRAKALLEGALGKNWGNLEARRLLRSIYFLEGEFDKGIELQRSLVEDSERRLREEEKSVLASMLAEARGEEALPEIEKLPLTPSSLALLVSSKDLKRKYLPKMFELGLQNEVVLILTERNLLSLELVEVVEDRKKEMSQSVLAVLYVSLGIRDRLEDLKENLPPPIKVITLKGLEGWECVSLWECSSCGKDYRRYAPMCENCLSWNKLKVKGGGLA